MFDTRSEIWVTRGESDEKIIKLKEFGQIEKDYLEFKKTKTNQEKKETYKSAFDFFFFNLNN